ncbi:hypothetical protein GF327_09415 [Candidatus Woesearchaeota archaeon]|nr:hypothetical protein [Candidatus Woesearchaeota archaeon]
MKSKADIFFEVSWEICNKVGGIYTVVSSKAVPTLKYYKNNYFPVGPYFKDKCFGEFEEQEPAEFLKKVFSDLKQYGIDCHFGKWLIEGEPNTILVDFQGFLGSNDRIKAGLWETFKIDSLGTDFYDYDYPILWSTAVGMLISKVKQALKDKTVVAQFHEWLSGGGLLYIKKNNVDVGTVFTTHATMLGRTLAGNHIDLYNELETIDPGKEAYKHKIQAKYLTERQCAKNADVFTTVSEITGMEATYLLGKKPDVLLPNGLDIDKFPTFEDASIKHKLLKRKMKEFLMHYFFPYYTFDLDNTLMYFLAGRYEVRDKGIDVYIKALSRLNKMLIKNNSEKTIVAFIWVPAFAASIKKQILENKTYYEDIKDSIYDISNEIRDRIVYGLISKKDLDADFILGNNLLRETKKRIIRFSREGIPDICTHHLTEENNEVISLIKEQGLINNKYDKVKLIYYPIYLTGADSLLDLNYYEAIMSSHLGVFPSYYEPWGYTPLETGALGIASLTTDLAGFGRYIKKRDTGKKNKGIFVLGRMDKTEEEVVIDLAEIMYRFSTYSKQDRIENKLKAKRIASMADWKNLIENYIHAHNLSVKKIRGE